jgi:hypothetical protein
MADNPYRPPRSEGEPVPQEESGLSVSIICPACGKDVHVGQDACAGCGRPLSKDERRALQRRWEASDREVARAADDTYWGRVAIGVAAAMASLSVVVVTVKLQVVASAATFAVALLLWGLFVVSFWQPLVACACALAVYGLTWLAQIVFAPTLSLDGILLRVIVLSALIGGLSAELKVRRRRQALGRRQQPGPPPG